MTAPWIPNDTSREAAQIQARIWRDMPSEQKHRIAAELSANVREIAAEGVRRAHPEYSDDEVRLAVIRRSLGDVVFLQAYSDTES